MSAKTAGVHIAPFGKFDHVSDWVFDLDNTLYPAECDLFAEIDTRMTDFVSRVLGLGPAEARRVQKHYYATYGTTLSGLMTVNRIEPADFLHYVHDIDLSPLPDLPDLRTALESLPGRKFVYTNGSRRHAERVTEKMGLSHLFHDSFGIEDAHYTPKPKQGSYDRFCELHGVDPKRSIFFAMTSSSTATMARCLAKSCEPSDLLKGRIRPVFWSRGKLTVEIGKPWLELISPSPLVQVGCGMNWRRVLVLPPPF